MNFWLLQSFHSVFVGTLSYSLRSRKAIRTSLFTVIFFLLPIWVKIYCQCKIFLLRIHNVYNLLWLFIFSCYFSETRLINLLTHSPSIFFIIFILVQRLICVIVLGFIYSFLVNPYTLFCCLWIVRCVTEIILGLSWLSVFSSFQAVFSASTFHFPLYSSHSSILFLVFFCYLFVSVFILYCFYC